MIITEKVSACLVCASTDSEVFEKTNSMMHEQNQEWCFRRCKDCEMIFLSPRVIQEKLGDYYTDSYLPYRGASAWGDYAKIVACDQKNVDAERVEVVKKKTHA